VTILRTVVIRQNAFLTHGGRGITTQGKGRMEKNVCQYLSVTLGNQDYKSININITHSLKTINESLAVIAMNKLGMYVIVSQASQWRVCVCVYVCVCVCSVMQCRCRMVCGVVSRGLL